MQGYWSQSCGDCGTLRLPINAGLVTFGRSQGSRPCGHRGSNDSGDPMIDNSPLPSQGEIGTQILRALVGKLMVKGVLSQDDPGP
jgi:hypothetical protein